MATEERLRRSQESADVDDNEGEDNRTTEKGAEVTGDH